MKFSAPLLLATLPLLTAATPPEITPEELVEFEQAVAPKTLPKMDLKGDLENASQAEAGLTTRLGKFLQTTGQMHLLTQVATTPPKTKLKEEDLFKPGEDRMVIRSDRAIYFDGNSNEFAYLGQVDLAVKGMTMSCNNGVKVIMNPPEKKPKKEGEKEKLGDFQGIGEVKQVTASGAIVLKGTNERGEPIEIRASRAVYNKEKNEVILRGKRMFFRNGAIALRNFRPKATAKVKLLGEGKITAIAEGGWEQGAPTDTLKKK